MNWWVAIFVVFSVFLAVRGEPIPPEADMTLLEIPEYYGYPSEQHFVITEDGYNLTMYRIPYGRKGNTNPGKRPAVLLQHGLLDSSFTWLFNLPGQSLSYVLADAGFDVWMGNNRGNTQSKCCPTTDGVKVHSKEWWQFNWDQMAKYDVPAFVGKILRVSGQGKLSYVGHSEGTTQFFANVVSEASVASKISSFVGLGPVIYVTHIEQGGIKLIAELHGDQIIAIFDDKQFLPFPEKIKELDEEFCATCPRCCNDVIEWLCGPVPNDQMNMSRMPLIGAFEPAGTSVMNIEHWGQMVRQEPFRMYDYGWTGNEKHYHQRHPPQYNMSNYPANLPTHLWSGTNDILADPVDVANLIDVLPPTVLHTQVREFAHLSFAWAVGDTAATFVSQVTSFLQKHA